jgi:hypothetical protein
VRVVAVDWSGRRRERRHLWLAEAADGVLLRLEAGRSREELGTHLEAEAARDPSLAVGLDFSFSLPAWFLDAHHGGDPEQLWEAARDDGEQWLTTCAPPFWGRPGKRRPAGLEQYRRTERALAPVAGIRPKPTFQIGGAGSVGSGSVRGWPVLARLRAAGFSIWPFHQPASPPVVVEMWPRALTGPVVKSDPSARAAYLERRFPELSPAHLVLAAAGEDAFDAAVSALVMSAHADELAALPRVTDSIELREGSVWTPAAQPSAARSRAADSAVACCTTAERSSVLE